MLFRRGWVATALAASLMLAACGDEGTGAATPAEEETAQPADTEAEDEDTGETGGQDETGEDGTISQESIDLALDFTGGTAGEADDSLDPVTIGFINTQGGPAGFPEATASIDAAAAFVNDHLGGVDSHPLEIATCLITGPDEEGQQCANEMLNDDDIQTVIVGSGPLHGTLGGNKPVLGMSQITPPDFAAEDAYAWRGGLPAMV